MTTECPLCDSIVPINTELLLKLKVNGIKCPSCKEYFSPNNSELEKAELKIEELKDELIINNSLKNIHRLFDDC
jgi:hypothetical protein